MERNKIIKEEMRKKCHETEMFVVFTYISFCPSIKNYILEFITLDCTAKFLNNTVG